MVTRNQLYILFRDENNNLPLKDINLVFMSLSDEQLASERGLRVLRKGYFY